MTTNKPTDSDELRGALDYLLPHSDLTVRAQAGVLAAAIETLRERERLYRHAAEQVENPEYVAALQQADVEYVEQFVARIAELKAALRDVLTKGEPRGHKLGPQPNGSQPGSCVWCAARAALSDDTGERE